MRPTLRDVARHAGVSVGTASNVVTGRRGVGAQARARVEAAIAELGYRPDPAGRALIARRHVMGRGVDPDRPRLTCVGYLCADLMARVDVLPHRDDRAMARTIERFLGGRAANVAATAAGLGAPLPVTAEVLTVLGWDAESDWAVEAMRTAGVAVHPSSRVQGKRLSRCLILVEASGHRTIVNEPLQVAPAVFTAWLEELTAAGPPHGLYLQADQLDALWPHLPELAARGLVLATHLAVDDVHRLGTERLDALAGRADLLVLGTAAARVLVGADGGRAHLVAALAERFEGARAAVVLTLGVEGAVWLEAGAVVAEATAPAIAAVDTTGAGDTFTGCLLAARLHRVDPARALRVAVAAASQSVATAGAQTHRLTAAAIGF